LSGEILTTLQQVLLTNPSGGDVLTTLQCVRLTNPRTVKF